MDPEKRNPEQTPPEDDPEAIIRQYYEGLESEIKEDQRERGATSRFAEAEKLVQERHEELKKDHDRLDEEEPPTDSKD